MSVAHTAQRLKEAMGFKEYNMAAWERYLFHAEIFDYRKCDDVLYQIVECMKTFHRAGSSRYHDEFEEYRSSGKGILDILFEHLRPENLSEYAEQIYDRQDETKLAKAMRGCKILVITANDIEKNILHYSIREMNRNERITRIIFGNVAYFVFRWGKYHVAHVHQYQIGGSRDHGMNATLQEALRVIRPNVIFSMGVAFGIDPETQNIGDVLVSRKILPYSENKIVDDHVYPDRSQDKNIDSWLDARFTNTPGFLESVIYGSILSGTTVLSSYRDKIRICTAYSKNDFVIGGEMEGSALYQTCYSYDIPCAVIKGICDWGAAKNSVYDGMPEKESHLKICAQAYAMTQVIEKCSILFQDGTLFNYPKSRAADAERKKSRWLATILVITNLSTILLGVYCLKVKALTISIALLLTAIISLSLTACMYHYWSNRYLRYPRL